IIYEWQYDDEPEDGYWWSIRWATTDAYGAYSARGLPPGTYRVLFYDPNFHYERQAFSNAPDIATGDDITLAEGERIANINADLVAGATIAGHVTEMDGSTPIQGIHAQAFRWNGSTWVEVGEANTDADGNYLISGLPAGLYRVRFSQWREYLWEVYDDIPYETWSDMAAGQDIVLTTSEALTGINANMVSASKIAGTLSSDIPEIPVEGILIQAWSWDGENWIESGSGDVIGCCGDEPNFLIGGLRPGTYRLTFTDLTGEFESTVWGGSSNLDEGIDLVVPPTTTVAEVNLTMEVVKPSVIDLRPTESGFAELDFHSRDGRFYVLQHAPAATGTWEDVGETLWAVGDASTLAITNTMQKHGMWRVRRVFGDE
ncbi:MAG TPA: carboxypeptidase regulatory-like domain-containing protein, partial [Verrucomicrobiota bacterium]|nr:carboxypeptidase regulatory-like domain-containing protein [Verrucomicrobiota bacterium]